MEHKKRKFAKIYDHNVEKIYRFIYLKIGSVETAEDLAAQVFAKSWKQFKSGKEIKNTSAYLFQVARAEIADYYRKGSRYKIISTQAVEVTDEAPTPEQEQKIKSDIEEMQDVLNELKEEHQDVLILRYIDDYSVEEIALMMNKSENAVRVMLHRALKELREKMEKPVIN